MLCARKRRSRSWIAFASRWKPRAAVPYRQAHSARPATTRSRSGRSTRFLEYPELELSNNLAENSMRPVAIGRKNWIHVGSPQAGPKIAAILSVIESCRRLKLPVRDYLAAVLPGLADLPIKRLPQLTPAAWNANRSRLFETRQS